jgi:integrase
MGSVRKPKYKNRAGQVVQTKDWYAYWTNARGKTQRKRIGRDKRAAEAYVVKMQDVVSRQKAGLAPEPTDAARLKSLSEWQADYLAALAVDGTGEDHRRNVAAHLDDLVAACGWLIWTDVTGDALAGYLARRRERGGRRGFETGKPKGNSPATCNAYLRSAKGFGNWVADQLGTASPFRKVRPMNEQVDRRRSKRILTDDEFGKVVAAAESCPPKHNAHVSGPDRAMLYRVAAGTGFRAGDLASLTPLCFALDATPPTVTVDPKYTKGRREEPIPLPAWLVERLRPWLAGRPPTDRLWPGGWAKEKRQQKWLARDVKRAGVAERDERGRTVTFHSLKRRYVTSLIRAGAKVHEVRRLARHKDARTTLDYYTDETLADLAALADKLPPG